MHYRCVFQPVPWLGRLLSSVCMKLSAFVKWLVTWVMFNSFKMIKMNQFWISFFSGILTASKKCTLDHLESFPKALLISPSHLSLMEMGWFLYSVCFQYNIHTLMDASGNNLGFRILPKDSLACRLEQPEISLPISKWPTLPPELQPCQRRLKKSD